jgi:hypothetical protein
MVFKALFIGLDYTHIEYRNLNNTTYLKKLIEYLKMVYNIDKKDYEILTEMSGTSDSILLHLYKLGLETWSQNLDYALIYYIGDSINLADYAQAYTGNFNNIKQGLVPSDYNMKGIIDNAEVLNIFDQYNPKTKIIFITDSCFLHGNIFNLEFDWSKRNITPYHKTCRKILSISYSLAKYASEDDNYYNILTENENIKSFANFIIKLGYMNDDIFNLLSDINNVFYKKNINMTVSLSASFYLTETDRNIFKCFEPNNKPKDDDFTSYAQTYQDITNELRKSHTTYEMQQYIPFTSIQPTQKIYECFC